MIGWNDVGAHKSDLSDSLQALIGWRGQSASQVSWCRRIYLCQWRMQSFADHSTKTCKAEGRPRGRPVACPAGPFIRARPLKEGGLSRARREDMASN